MNESFKTQQNNNLNSNENYQYALLADSAYIGIINNTSAGIANELTGRLSKAQAEYVADNFNLFAQTPESADGFNAQVWKRKDGKIIVAIR